MTKDGILLKLNKIWLPKSLEKRALETAHVHQGSTRMKSLIREKVWFEDINQKVEQIMAKCLACQAVVQSYASEPLRMTEVPDRPGESFVCDFYGPLMSGSYLMVIIDECSRFPIVEEVKRLTSEEIIKVLEKVFSIFGIPDTLKSDNGPPFNGHKIKLFAEHLAFKHQKITPLHPRANGLCERFMKNITKVLQTASIEAKDWHSELHKFLGVYRTTPHASTGIAPNQLMFTYDPRTSKLPQFPDVRINHDLHERLRENDERAKLKMKQYNDRNRNVHPIYINEGDLVLVRQRKMNKLTPYFSPNPYKVVSRKGTMITATRSDHRITRDVSHFKKVSGIMISKRKEGDEDIWFPIPNDSANRNPPINVNIPEVPGRIDPRAEASAHRQQELAVETQSNEWVELNAEMNPDTIELSSNEAGDIELSPDTNEQSPNASALSIIIESPNRVQSEEAEEIRAGPANQVESVASTRPVRSKSMPNRLVVNPHAKKTYD